MLLYSSCGKKAVYTRLTASYAPVFPESFSMLSVLYALTLFRLINGIFQALGGIYQSNVSLP